VTGTAWEGNRKDVRLKQNSGRLQTQRTAVQKFFEELQATICRACASVDGRAGFTDDRWQHPESGGGITRVIQQGRTFEKGGVNVSTVGSTLSPALAERMKVPPQSFFASGISLVLHPLSPMIPTVHANFRYFELESGDSWFGGGCDLTPSYLFEEDARHFHAILKSVCDQHNPGYYARFKQWCDEYFFLKHRNETRGIGGIFFDYLRGEFDPLFAFVRDCGNSFLEAYLPIVERRRELVWTENERRWQLLRRGRYVEFNLIYDRGTLFGLETQGRTESILMSLPPTVRWEYAAEPAEGSREAHLMEILRNPRAWVGPGE
jgi:coproporphyrinogen III oxidase